MNIDSNILYNSIGKKLKFEATYYIKNSKPYTYIFYAELSEVFDNYIIVKQFTVQSDEKVLIVKRKLVKGKFEIDFRTTQLNH